MTAFFLCRNPENHGDEQPRIIPDADRENSASSCARERQGIVGPSLSSEAVIKLHYNTISCSFLDQRISHLFASMILIGFIKMIHNYPYLHICLLYLSEQALWESFFAYQI